MSNRLRNKYLAAGVLLVLIGIIPSGLTYAGTPTLAKTGQEIRADAQTPVEGVTKNETVYVKLAPDGSVTDTTVVNWIHFRNAHPVTMEDPVELTQAKALNGSFKVKTDNQKVLISAIPKDSKDLFYSGQTNKKLPLNVKITFYLNGHSIMPTELIGKSGTVKIVINVSNQTIKDGKNIAGKTIYTPFMSMLSLDLPVDKFSDVDAPEGIITVVGETMKLNWVLFPYPNSEAVLTMKAEDFELDSINIAAVPKMPPLPEVNVEDKLTDLSNGLDEMDHALGQLQTGSQQLAVGQDQMGTGLTKVSEGMGKIKLLNQVEVKLGNGILLINSQLVKGLEPLQTQAVIGDALKPIVAGLQRQQALLTALVNGGQVEGQAVPPLATTGAKMDEMKVGLDQLAQGTSAAKTGAEQLNNGVGQVRQQGIKKMQEGIAASLQEARSGELQKQELEKMVSNYKTFTGTSDSIPSNVQFIIQTVPIGIK